MRMPFEQRKQDPVQRLSPPVQRPYLDFALSRDQLDRRTDRRHVPARISLRILIARRKIDPAPPIELPQQILQPPFVRYFRGGASDADSRRGSVAKLRHKARGGIEITGYHRWHML